jgi:N-formylmaleamate deformylase
MTSTFVRGANVHANGIRQHYLRFGGEGRKLLLVPGITSPAITWGFVAERLGRHFDTYVFDLRGRGLSETGAHLDYGLDACAADLAAFALAMEFTEYDIIGHSMGARIAIRAASANPPGLGKLVLVDPPVTGPGRRAYPTPLSWYIGSIRLAVKGIDGDALKPFSPSWTDAQRQLRAEWLHTCDERAIVKSYDDFHDTDIHGDFAKLTAPTLLVAAGKGGVILPEDIDELCALKPSLKVARVETAGHMIPWDDFEAFFPSFGAFLGTPDL